MSRPTPAQEDAARRIATDEVHHCLVFTRQSFGSSSTEQTDNAQKWIVNKLGAEYVVSTRILFHGHFGNADKLKAALNKSQQLTGPLQPAGQKCMQKNCGQQKHSVEARIVRAGLDYSSVRRWILANKRIILTEEVFRDARQEEKEKNDEISMKKRNISIDQVKQDIQKTQQQLGYTPLTPKEQAEQPVQPLEDNKPNQSTQSQDNNQQQSSTPTTAPTATATPAAPNNNPGTSNNGVSNNGVSSPPASSSVAPVKKPGSGLKVYVKSRQGQSWDPSKVNQDRPLACVPLRGHPGVHVYGVMDGHGQHGHYVSEYVMHQLPAFLAAEKSLKTDTSNSITSAVAKMCSALQESNINLAFSGSTCVFGVHIDKAMYVANIGDSRCVVCREGDNGQPITIALTTDHKPDSPGEMERILAAGGRVCPIPGMDAGPNRVWLAELDEPGLAMARSIGDEVSQTVGVISVPEIQTHQINDKDLFAIFASDGVWEFLGNEEVIGMLYKNIHDPALAVNQLVAESVRRWQEDSEQVIDDITVVLVMFR